MQIFPKSLNHLPVVLGVGTLVAGTVVVGLFWYYFSPKNLQVGYEPEQPVAYSHALHAGSLGMDCRYCHANVEQAAHAMVPPTQTCMGCHSLVKTDSELLEPVRKSWKDDEPLRWVKVHKLPDHTYFDHSAHVAAGVGCRSCHGRVDNMEVVRVVAPLSMGWCLSCHRDPRPHLRQPDRVTDMSCSIGGESCASDDNCCGGECDEENGVCTVLELAQVNPERAQGDPLHPPTYCSGCHR